MSLTPETVSRRLKMVKYPGFTRDIVSFGIVKDISVDEKSAVKISLVLPKPDPDVQKRIEDDVRTAVLETPGVEGVSIETQVRASSGAQSAGAAQQQPAQSKLPGIKHYVAVASGKGGVGKSTVAVNLAVAIGKKRQNVGLMDADIWGPSAPMMTGTQGERPIATPEKKILPIEKYGLKMVSIGYLIKEEETVIWRGPMVHGAVKQFIEDVEWGNTDYLVIDLPPGTGDAQLSIAQTAPLSGGVIVTTPQEVSLIDVRRGILMFEKLNIPVIGIVENMSYLDIPGGEKMDIFGRGGGKQMAEKFNVPFLGEIPIDPEIRKGGDSGVPIVESTPDCTSSLAFMRIADEVLDHVEK
ncbi:MAG: P-loop NTPase [Candidatus Mycalebacterium zealandia]|nr:MAG: P-loop NTPase [Candidatus Mycalebacterium zealandia]